MVVNSLNTRSKAASVLAPWGVSHHCHKGLRTYGTNWYLLVSFGIFCNATVFSPCPHSEDHPEFPSLQMGRVWCSLACGWTNTSVVRDLIRSLGCWAVRASHGAKCTGKWKWTGSGGKQRRKKKQWDTGLEAEACVAVEILVEIQASLVGIIPLDTERRMRSWRRNGLMKMDYSHNSACWGWQESQWWEGDFSTSPPGGVLDSAAVLSWGVCMHQTFLSEPFQILSYRPWQIGVALDHDGGKATFTNARLKSSSMNSHLPSLGEFSLSCGLTAGGPNLHWDPERRAPGTAPGFFI